MAGGINTYNYVSNNPLGNIDPYGLIDGATMTGLGAASMAVPIPGARVFGAVVMGIGIATMSGDTPKKKDVPDTGPPGEWVDGERRKRKYGPDGKPEVDIDKPHQGYPDDHVHEWPDGKREHPGRPVCPTD